VIRVSFKSENFRSVQFLQSGAMPAFLCISSRLTVITRMSAFNASILQAEARQIWCNFDVGTSITNSNNAATH